MNTHRDTHTERESDTQQRKFVKNETEKKTLQQNEIDGHKCN